MTQLQHIAAPRAFLTPEDILPVAMSLLEGESDPVANMANLSALLFEALPNINWAGFYCLDKAGGELVLGPFQGRLACTRIPVGRGVCGVAAQKRQVQRVADVHSFAGHIACDSRSVSEIVLPVFFRPAWPEQIGRPQNSQERSLYGVLDIDSPDPDRFSAEDQAMLEKLVSLFEQTLEEGAGNNPEADKA